MKRSDVTFGKGYSDRYIIFAPSILAPVLNPRLAACTTAEEVDAVLDAFFAVIGVPVPNEVTLMLPVTFYIKNNVLYSRDIVSYDRFVGANFNNRVPLPLYTEIQNAGCRNAKDALRYLATRPERLCMSRDSL